MPDRIIASLYRDDDGRAVAPVSHSCCASCLVRRYSGDVTRLPCRQRHPVHHRFRCVALCRSTWIVEGLAWDCTFAPPLGALLARIKGPGRRCTEVCVGFATSFPLSRGVSWRRSARHSHRYLNNSCCMRGGGDLWCTKLLWGTNSRACFLPPRPVGYCKDA